MAPSATTTTASTRTTSKTTTTTRRTRQQRRTTNIKKKQHYTRSKKQEVVLVPTVLPSTCSSTSSQDSSKEVNMDMNMHGSEVIDVSESACSTPKGQKFMIPEISTCPPAPKKPRVLSNCSLRRSPLSFFTPPDLEHFFLVALRDVSV